MAQTPRIVALVMVFALCATSAASETLGFSVTIGQDSFALVNESDSARIDQLVLQTDGVYWFFDAASGSFSSGAGSAMLISPDALVNDVRSDLLEFDFTGFLPGDRFLADVALETGPGADGGALSGSLFNNGDIVNTMVYVTFSRGGLQVGYRLNDTAQGFDDNPYTSTTCGLAPSQTCSLSVAFEVPEPSTLLLAASVLAVALARALLQLL